VLKVIAEALDLSTDTLLAHVGLVERRSTPGTEGVDTATAIRTDSELTEQQKSALLAVYRTYRETNGARRHPQLIAERRKPPAGFAEILGANKSLFD
jgi:hypothetical protein